MVQTVLGTIAILVVIEFAFSLLRFRRRFTAVNGD